MKWLKRIAKWFAAAVAAVVLGVMLFLLVLWLEHNSALELPRPTGPFAVGRMVTTWMDGNRADPFAPPPGHKRELLVWIWYPARPSGQSTQAEYVPRFWREAPDEHASPFLTHFVWRNPSKVRAHSFEGADLAPDREKYPVVIFRSGIGAMSLDYTTLVEDLASHGYIVVGADAPYSTWSVVMPDGRVIHKTDQGNPGDAPISASERGRLLQALLGVWVADTRFLLDQLAALNPSDLSNRFTGKIDLGAVGIAGHSFGGATAAQVSHDDTRFRAGINLDGALQGSVVREGIAQPFLFLLSDHGDALTSPDREIFNDIRSSASRAPDDKLIVTLNGAHHFSFSDNPLIQSRILRSLLVALGGPGGRLDARAGLAATAQYVREFFDVHLRGAPREALYSSPLVPAARIEPKQPANR